MRRNVCAEPGPERQGVRREAGSAGGCEQELPNGRIVEVRSGPLAGSCGWVATFEDITARRHAEKQVVFMARHDVLTRLPNRTVFRERIEAAVAQSGRAVAAAVLCLDLDHFKAVNDTLGHPIGDLLLREVGERLSACVREQDTVARFGGDEFAVLQIGPERTRGCRAAGPAHNRHSRAIPMRSMGTKSTSVSASGSHGHPPTERTRNAAEERRHGVVSCQGRRTRHIPFLRTGNGHPVAGAPHLELELRKALTNGEFELFYQPHGQLQTGEIVASKR